MDGSSSESCPMADCGTGVELNRFCYQRVVYLINRGFAQSSGIRNACTFVSRFNDDVSNV